VIPKKSKFDFFGGGTNAGATAQSKVSVISGVSAASEIVSPEEKRRLAIEKEKAAIAAKREVVPDKMFKEPDVKKTMARYLQAATSKKKKVDTMSENTA
jgi:hypothetical protein